MSVEEVVMKATQRKGVAAEPASTHIGQLLLHAGKLTEGDIKKVVNLQSERDLRFGDAALILGLVERQDIQQALSRQFGYPYLSPEDSSLSEELIAAYQPFSEQTEALRRLRTQLSIRWFNDRSKTLAIASARDGEGASSIAANLAIVFAQLGERTLLIDANFRNPRQHQFFGLRPDAGLSSVLAGRLSCKDAIVRIDAMENLSVLAAGPVPPNPQELLARVGFSYVMETVPCGFDVVIVDTPPMLEYADAQTIIARAHGCVLTIRRHAARIVDVERCRSLIGPTAAAIVGTVICD